MSIPYNFEVIKTDVDARVMEVVYTSPGRPPFHIGVPLPNVGESPTALIRSYAPVANWLEVGRQVQVVPVGLTGTETPDVPPETLESAKARKITEIADWRYRRETGGVTFGGALIRTDRESQATITGAFIALSQGLVLSVDWKAANGQWIQIGLQEMTAIAQAVSAHVQNSFTLERQYVQMVDQATTIEQVQNIVLPSV